MWFLGTAEDLRTFHLTFTTQADKNVKSARSSKTWRSPRKLELVLSWPPPQFFLLGPLWSFFDLANESLLPKITISQVYVKSLGCAGEGLVFRADFFFLAGDRETEGKSTKDHSTEVSLSAMGAWLKTEPCTQKQFTHQVSYFASPDRADL